MYGVAIQRFLICSSLTTGTLPTFHASDIRTDSRDLPKAAGNAWSHSWSEAGSSRVTVDP